MDYHAAAYMHCRIPPGSTMTEVEAYTDSHPVITYTPHPLKENTHPTPPVTTAKKKHKSKEDEVFIRIHLLNENGNMHNCIHACVGIF